MTLSKLFDMEVWVFAGGEETERLPESLGGDGGADLVIAADGGLRWAQRLGVQADVVVGDMDSVDGAALAEVEAGGAEIVRHDPDKDATDLELALRLACERGASSITLIGGHGGRLDHFLGNIALLASLPKEVQAQALMGDTEITVLHGTGTNGTGNKSSSRLLDGEPGRQVSLIPWGGDASGVSTTALRWPLASETLPLGTSRGISNEMTGTQAEVSLESGTLLVIMNS